MQILTKLHLPKAKREPRTPPKKKHVKLEPQQSPPSTPNQQNCPHNPTILALAPTHSPQISHNTNHSPSKQHHVAPLSSEEQPGGSPMVLLFLLLLLTARGSHSLTEAEALLRLKSSFNQSAAEDGEDALASWVPDSVPCGARWAGIMCFDGVITGLHLTGMGLSGSIDIDALVQIKGLRTISLKNNNFSGPMPEFNRLGVVKALLLSGNSFSGEIPQDFFSHLNSLKKVWLNENNFSGKIPNSIAQLNHLIELHLENNQFEGPIPKFKEAISSLDLSNNKLEGQIPEILATYNATAFSGNSGLCGKPLNKPCQGSPPEPVSATSQALAQQKDNNTKLIIGGVIATMVAVLLYALLSSKNSQDDDFSQLDRDHIGPDVEVDGSSHRRTSAPAAAAAAAVAGESTQKGSSPQEKGGGGGGGGMTDLVMVNEEKGIRFGMTDLMKAAAEVLGNGGLGSAYKAVMTNGVSVAVKRMREMNRLGREGFDAEMRRFGRLRHRNVLTPLAYHYRREEKLLVSEYIPKGSLLYVLHGDRGSEHAELNWPTRLKIAKGVARGLGFLYKEFSGIDLPHGNLKSSNVLLQDDHEPLLSDYAFLPLMNPANAAQAMFAYKTPDYAHLQRVSQKTDVYCLGIILLEILTGKFPSQYLSNGKGGTDVVQWALSATGSEEGERELLDPEMLAGVGHSSVVQMRRLLRVATACVEENPQQRIDMREAIRRIEEVHAG